MSSLIVEVVKIDEILDHPNADKLELAKIKGWICVVRKDSFKVGDKAIYIPIDSILPESLETKIFTEGSKITLNNHRVKTIKIRKAVSQGLLVTLDSIGLKDYPIGTDVKDVLGIKKSEPPSAPFRGFKGGQTSKKISNPNFTKYIDIENYKNYNNVFQPDDYVVITEKIHGTNFRCGWVEFATDTWWKKIKKFLGLAPKYEFVYGSHNIQLQNKFISKDFYSKQGEGNVYAKTVAQYNLKEKLDKGIVVYGEIYGDGIQKNYTYGCEKGERKLVIFDIKKDGKYLDNHKVLEYCLNKDFDVPPLLYSGKFKEVNLDKLVQGKSVLCSKQKVREGIVIKSITEEICCISRKILKHINPDYLLKDNTDFH